MKASNAICPKMFSPTHFDGKNPATSSFEASKCAGDRGSKDRSPYCCSLIPPIPPLTRRISDFLASLRGFNLDRFFDVPP
ncbi:hypothetical protein AVEN_82679-1 [Araneus ventricosus]|uniref:Uncharacterized protein n=1 Tax=Araneus ventricosus TaxID=182803 RepID=A0A4Y2PXC2_ARAVE|nr:hypothetical protein AVEN_82679-1 [Araneus ventricosus]